CAGRRHPDRRCVTALFPPEIGTSTSVGAGDPRVKSWIAMAPQPPLIEADKVTKVYRIGKVDVPALRGVSLRVERGEFVSIVGPSGSGKSTLFYILGGLTGPT